MHPELAAGNIGPICQKHSSERHATWQQENRDTEIQVGDLVKLAFPFSIGEEQSKEWMWVIVEAVTSPQEFTGRVDNDPIYATKFPYQSQVTFTRDEIADYIKGE